MQILSLVNKLDLSDFEFNTRITPEGVSRLKTTCSFDGYLPREDSTDTCSRFDRKDRKKLYSFDVIQRRTLSHMCDNKCLSSILCHALFKLYIAQKRLFCNFKHKCM